MSGIHLEGFEFEANLRFCLKKPKMYFSQGICAHRSSLVPSPLLHNARPVWSNNHDTLELFAFLALLQPNFASGSVQEAPGGEGRDWGGAADPHGSRVALGGGLSGAISAAGRSSSALRSSLGRGAGLQLRQEELGPW